MPTAAPLSSPTVPPSIPIPSIPLLTPVITAPPSSVGEPFPTSVLGMPVVTTKQAGDLAAEGRLDGRDVAVAGWFFQGYYSCPWNGTYVGTLENSCRITAFADTEEAAHVCHSGGCSGFGRSVIDPWLLSDTLGQVDFKGQDNPVPIVAIGHLKDPRSFHCRPGADAGCANDFVVDRVAWAGGAETTPKPEAFDYSYYQAVVPNLTLDGLAGVVGSDQTIVSAVATTADGVRSFDPRWNLASHDVYWVVRSVPSSSADPSDQTRPVTVWLIADGSASVTASESLALAADYEPARLWVTVAQKKSDPHRNQNISPSYRVVNADGSAAQDGRVRNGVFSQHGTATYGPDLPLLLQSGTYTLSAWLEAADETADPIGQCETTASLAPGDDVMLQALFASEKPCTWSNSATPSFGFP